MLIAHISDTHLGYRQYNSDKREQDFYDAFKECIDKIIEEHVDIVIHSGDLFETPRPSTEALLEVLKAIRQLYEKGIKIYAIPGSHDQPKRKGRKPPHALYEQLGVKVLRYNHPKAVEGDLFIAGVQYVPRIFRQALLEKLEALSREAEKYRKRILILHQAIDKYFPLSYELSLSELPPNFHYYALGHIHRRIVDRYGEGILAYAGSTEIWSKDECSSYEKDGKGFYIVDLSGDEPLIHKIDLECIRPQLTYVVHYGKQPFAKQIVNIREKLPKTGKKPVLHLEITGQNIDKRLVQRIANKHLKDHVAILRFYFKDETPIERESHEPIAEINMRKLLKKHLKSDPWVELALQLLDVLSKGDTTAALQLTKEFYEKGEWL